ncbi:hypothetical protein ACG33_11775 [Steroidobacter denitrificans]|uniref:TonB-dependent receptor plug domain-containing protein n=2 Tax=Steroidobacter denitrificans TaxID=465721 RepID=A0A127FBG7_STEDE|nr:hypothetical protein ACG33_11775 [Steroidobacter denitrificans]
MVLGVPSGASAQESGASIVDSRAGVEEVIVTARRRSEDLARVPGTIAVFGQDQLIERAIRSDSDLQLVAPGLTIRQTQGNNSLTYSIRGQSADTFSGSPSAVIAYMNEVPLTIGSASSFYDLESIQVLKGPQGTLFGRNTTGGAVLYTSAKPTNEFAARFRGRVGNLDLREIEGMVNIPIVDNTVLLRAAFSIVDRDGYIHNRANNSYLGELSRTSGRVSLTIKPSETVTNDTVFQYADIGGTNTGASYTYSAYPCGATNHGFVLTCSSGLLFSPALDDVVATPGAWANYLAAHPDAYAPGLLAYIEEQRRNGAYSTYYPLGAKQDGKDWLLSNTTSFDVNDNLQIRNIFGASRSESDSDRPQIGAPFITILTANLDTGEVGNESLIKSISEELQLQGRTDSGSLDYIVGFYFQREEGDTIWPQTYFDLSPVLLPSSVTNAFRIENKTSALYAQGTWDVSSWIDNLRLTAGIRYTWEKVRIKQLPRATYTYGMPDQHNSFSDPSWELGLEYQATPSLFAYIKTRGSFRSGGFNGSAPPVDAPAEQGGNIFKSEQTQDIEAGLKSRGSLFGRPANLSLAVYHQWIQDVQRVEFPDPDGPGGLASIAVTANVPSAKVYGLELEASIMPTDWLQLGLTGAYTHASFSDGNVELFGTAYKYGPVGDTPEVSGTFFAQVHFPTSENTGDISLRGEVYAQTSQYFSNAADSVALDTELPGYGVVSGRLQWANIMGTRLSAALFGKNLLDKTYFVGGMTLASALGHNAAAVGEPRTYGLELAYEF